MNRPTHRHSVSIRISSVPPLSTSFLHQQSKQSSPIQSIFPNKQTNQPHASLHFFTSPPNQPTKPPQKHQSIISNGPIHHLHSLLPQPLPLPPTLHLVHHLIHLLLHPRPLQQRRPRPRLQRQLPPRRRHHRRLHPAARPPRLRQGRQGIRLLRLL